MYGKIIGNNRVEFAPNRILIGDQQIFNPTDEELESLGYKVLVYNDPPEILDDYYLIDGWAEIGEYIVQNWHYEPKSDEIKAEELLNIIVGV